MWLKGVSRAVCVGVALKFEDMALKAWRFYGLMTIAIGIPLSLIYGLRLDMMPWVTSVLIGYLALELLSLSLLLLSVGTSRYRHPAVSHNPPPQPDHHSKDQPTVAVIIAAYNEEAMLPETVDGVLAQSVQPDRILVVDDGSSDGSLEVLAERYGVVYRDGIGRSPNYPSLQVLAKHHSGKAESLNAGVRLLQDDVVVTVDADTQMKAGSIAAVKTYFANDPELKVIGPLMEPVCEPGPLAKAMQTLQRYEYLRSFTTQAAWSRIDGTLTVSGACAAYRRDILMAVGAFDPTSWVEDYEVMVRIYRYCRAKHLRPKVLISPYLTATTDAPNSVRSFIHQRRRWIGGFLQTL
ncbi:MAG: glycosyltransferase family 2 protein, partial [Cyanobacteria bacterium P01_D01_bin.73]